MLRKSLLATIAVLIAAPSQASAAPVGAFIGILASGAGFAAAGAAFVAAGGWSAIGAFLLSPFGSLLLSIGLQLVTSLFIKKPDAPSIEASKVNVKIPEPERWLAGGRTRQGGGVVFAEFDSSGNFWYVVVHADTTLNSVEKLFFDDNEIILDENNFVETNEFCLTDGGENYSGTGTKVKYFQVFTTTHTADNPTPPAISELQSAFPGVWTADHKLVGTTYSAIKVNPIKPENRYKVLKWRGPVGIGEPSFSIVGNWSAAYNPNDLNHVKGDVSTYDFTRNAVLLWAWYRTHRYGRNKEIDTINWDKVAEQALICDIVKNDIDGGNAPQYRCDIAIAESAERTVGEQQILMSCDAQLVFDDDGKCWPRVGYYYSPELNLYRNRDIIAMESVEAQNGESLTQGVIVRYMDPDANYSGQPCAPYVNPFYYVEGETPKYLVVDILTIQNHRQAMQLAKSISHRSQPEHKLLPTTGLRGLKARQERIVGLQYDNDFSGDYEIVTPTEIDTNGAFIGFGCVPIDQDRWNFLPGEEKSKPIHADSESLQIPTLPSGVLVEFQNNRIEISYDVPTRQDWFYEFQYQLKPGGVVTPDDGSWLNMVVQSNDNYAYSGGIILNNDYFVRWRGVSTGGYVSDWISPIPTVNTSTLTLTGTVVSPATVNVTYTGFTIGVTGGQSPYIYIDIYGRLPDGLTINSATGEISGTPNTIGTYANISIRVQDQNGSFKNFPEFTIEIEAA